MRAHGLHASKMSTPPSLFVSAVLLHVEVHGYLKCFLSFCHKYFLCDTYQPYARADSAHCLQ
jgi:hypothetical protein